MKRGKAWGVLTWRGVTDATPRRIRCAAVCFTKPRLLRLHALRARRAAFAAAGV
jgi:hypothetical protein